jgi:hypothetical protein
MKENSADYLVNIAEANGAMVAAFAGGCSKDGSLDP